jgi:hypothetical protein
MPLLHHASDFFHASNLFHWQLTQRLCPGGVGAAHFCPWCDDTTADRIFFFEMKKTSPGDNIFSVAKACGVFPQDIWEVNTAAHRESARSPETAIGLQVHALSLWKHSDSLPLPPSRQSGGSDDHSDQLGTKMDPPWPSGYSLACSHSLLV